MRNTDSSLQDNGAKPIGILEIDAEGAELAAMDEFLNSYRPFKVSCTLLSISVTFQIMIEIHGTPSQNIDFLQMFPFKRYYFVHYGII